MSAPSRFGQLVAMGLVGRAEAIVCLAEAARRAAPHGDERGMRARLCHALDDAAAFFRRARDRAPWRVRDALAPLLETLASRAELIEAGFAAAGDSLAPAEARALIEDAVRRHLSRRGR